ncbi:Fructosamine kinase domain containing protein [Rhypophila sp. PSN 637]
MVIVIQPRVLKLNRDQNSSYDRKIFRAHLSKTIPIYRRHGSTITRHHVIVPVKENPILAGASGSMPMSRNIYLGSRMPSTDANTTRPNCGIASQRLTSYTATGLSGYRILEADYESMVAMEEITPSNTFGFIARGWYASEEPEKTYFLLFDYKELAEPEEVYPVRLGQAIARLHTKSRASDHYPPKNQALGGKRFGFDRQTYCHTFQQYHEWSLAWHEFVAKHTEKLLESELPTWGEERRSDEHEQLCVALVERVILRLLRPLETDGRTIDPVLVHGNLDYGGFSKDMGEGDNHGETIFHNGGVLWAHNEYDLGPFFALWTHDKREETFVGRVLAAYHQTIPKAEPVEGWEARLRLYSLRTFIHNSAVKPKNQRARDNMIDQIKLLVDKFGGDETPQHERPMSPSGESSCSTCSSSSAGASVDTADLPSEAERWREPGADGKWQRAAPLELEIAEQTQQSLRSRAGTEYHFIAASDEAYSSQVILQTQSNSGSQLVQVPQDIQPQASAPEVPQPQGSD